ncbi:MAG: isoprenylcysteine carboxyl methyltransferase family protein [Stellaceae bacterium]
MSWAALIVALVAIERGAELIHAQRNTRRLLAQGAIERGAGHYRLIVALHAAWLVSILVFAPKDAAPVWGWLAIYLLLQSARFWVLVALGPYWTTRVITLPAAPLVRRGPYRFLRHPNYAVVIGEIAVLPLVFGEWRVALIFSTLNLALLAWRVRVENETLAERS